MVDVGGHRLLLRLSHDELADRDAQPYLSLPFRLGAEDAVRAAFHLGLPVHVRLVPDAPAVHGTAGLASLGPADALGDTGFRADFSAVSRNPRFSSRAPGRSVRGRTLSQDVCPRRAAQLGPLAACRVVGGHRPGGVRQRRSLGAVVFLGLAWPDCPVHSVGPSTPFGRRCGSISLGGFFEKGLWRDETC